MKTAFRCGLLAIAACLPAVGEGAEEKAVVKGLVVMFTDYGADSIYVGILKGAMYAKFPDVRIDSITNSVPPYDIQSGAYQLAEACGSYPQGTIFACVVDPGVGTERRCIALRTKSGQTFVGPDNGLLTLVAQMFGVEEMRECTNEAMWRSGSHTSTTFHGRDIFGPVAASLAGGAKFEGVGPTMESMVTIDLPVSRIENGTALGGVMRTDWYGNVVTTVTLRNLTELGIKEGDSIAIELNGERFVAPLARTYGAVPKGSRLVVVQSSGFIECAINQGNLADAAKAEPGQKVIMKKAK
ncbi:MAG: DNA-directed RNA polymerase subunit delta [Candidatus Hydrogenedentota bacterium]